MLVELCLERVDRWSERWVGLWMETRLAGKEQKGVRRCKLCMQFGQKWLKNTIINFTRNIDDLSQIDFRWQKS